MYEKKIKAACILLLFAVFVLSFFVVKSGKKADYESERTAGKAFAEKKMQAASPYVCLRLSKEFISAKKVALTFDDGPHPQYTRQLLDGLRERGVQATFFVLGMHAEENPELIKRMHEEGHLIGNHTYSHIQLQSGNEETFKDELVKTNEIIRGITGEEVLFVRPPYGSWNKGLEKELNMIPVLWNVDPLDWTVRDKSLIVRRALKAVRENSVILLHDNYESSVLAALEIVDTLKEQGYEFVTVEEILFD